MIIRRLSLSRCGQRRRSSPGAGRQDRGRPGGSGRIGVGGKEAQQRLGQGRIAGEPLPDHGDRINAQSLAGRQGKLRRSGGQGSQRGQAVASPAFSDAGLQASNFAPVDRKMRREFFPAMPEQEPGLFRGQAGPGRQEFGQPRVRFTAEFAHGRRGQRQVGRQDTPQGGGHQPGPA